MKISAKKYLLYSSVFAIFTEAYFFKYIIDWKLLYLIIAVNYVVLLKMKSLKFNIYFIGLIVALFAHGLIANTIVGIPYNYMLAQIIGISVVATYYYNFTRLYEQRELVGVYANMSLYIAIIGYFLYYWHRNDETYRLMSIFKEPAHFAIVVIPACYYFFKTREYLKFIVIFGSLILSNSSLGYVGCGLIFILPNLTLRRIGYLTAFVPIVFTAFYFAYKELPFFKIRIDDTYNSLNVIRTGKFDEGTNLSSYVMITNLYVAQRNFSENPLGSGIGSHHHQHVNLYLKEVRPPNYIKTLGHQADNSNDANSLFTRLVSELGIFGLLLIIFAMYRAAKCYNSPSMFIEQGIYIYFLLKLFRDGHYFPPEFFLFIWIFYFGYKAELTSTRRVLQ